MRAKRWFTVVMLLAAALPLIGVRAEEEVEDAHVARTTIDDLAWLAGTWRNEKGVMPFEEVWTSPWGGTMTAVSRGLREGKTSMVELSSIEPVDGELVLYLRHFHSALVPWAEEKEGALAWTLAEAKENRVVFRNEKRAFPREIIYERDGDVLNAILAGTQRGTEAQMGFELHRVAGR